MAKKVKVPVALRLVRWIFPKLEKYSPPLATRLFVQLFFTPLHYGFPEKEMVWVNKSRSSFITVNRKKVQVYSWGEVDKPYILFLHGWAGRGTQFSRFFPSILDSGFRIITFDGPAHGKSDGKRTNVAEFVDVLKLVIEKFGAPKVVVAHSFGGVVALMGKSIDLPIKRLINIGSPAIGDEIIKTFLREVNGSWSTAEAFKKYMVKKYNRSFDEFSGEFFIKQLKDDLDLLLVHDDIDKDVPLIHVFRVLELYPKAILFKTVGLGHTRILKDEMVIEFCLEFISRDG